jgi:hypothetical protein
VEKSKIVGFERRRVSVAMNTSHPWVPAFEQPGLAWPLQVDPIIASVRRATA